MSIPQSTEAKPALTIVTDEQPVKKPIKKKQAKPVPAKPAKPVKAKKKKKPAAKPVVKQPEPVQTKFKKNREFNAEKFIREMIRARSNNNHSILKAAEICGIPKSTFQQIEASGICMPDALSKISNYLKMPVQSFF